MRVLWLEHPPEDKSHDQLPSYLPVSQLTLTKDLCTTVHNVRVPPRLLRRRVLVIQRSTKEREPFAELKNLRKVVVRRSAFDDGYGDVGIEGEAVGEDAAGCSTA